jgi:hypothetical protein
MRTQDLIEQLKDHARFLESVAYATEHLNKDTDRPHNADYYKGKAAGYRNAALWLLEELSEVEA